jgi:hypothetical protein
MIETDHSVNFGPTEVQCLGDLRFCLTVNAAELGLNFVQNGQQRACATGVG